MKIGIITVPFNWNYGGILQNYALQECLKELGHDAITINRNRKIMPLKLKIFSFSKRFILKYILQRNVIVRTWPTKQEFDIIKQNTDQFIAEHIKTTRLLKSERELKTLDRYNIDAYITGSDQVWRAKYFPKPKSYFLGFLSPDSKVKRISYAASFGTDKWEFTEKQTNICKKLLSRFDAVSVREKSGVNLCQKYLGVTPTLTLDPTFLVSKKEYVKLVELDNIQPIEGGLFHYVLDSSNEKKQLINNIANKLNLTSYSSTTKNNFYEVGKSRLDDCIFPPVTQWLREFIDAEFVITDSFHGSIFSIIFNKPFIAIGNSKRGLARFHSLLSTFELEERLINKDIKNIDELLNKKIDFQKVNEILKRKKEESFSFLKQALK